LWLCWKLFFSLRHKYDVSLLRRRRKLHYMSRMRKPSIFKMKLLQPPRVGRR
jgi:hypothetical protein